MKTIVQSERVQSRNYLQTATSEPQSCNDDAAAYVAPFCGWRSDHRPSRTISGGHSVTAATTDHRRAESFTVTAAAAIPSRSSPTAPRRSPTVTNRDAPIIASSAIRRRRTSLQIQTGTVLSSWHSTSYVPPPPPASPTFATTSCVLFRRHRSPAVPTPLADTFASPHAPSPAPRRFGHPGALHQRGTTPATIIDRRGSTGCSVLPRSSSASSALLAAARRRRRRG